MEIPQTCRRYIWPVTLYICHLSLFFPILLPPLLREIAKYFFWLDNFYQPIFIRAELLFHTIYCNFIQNPRFMQVFFIAGIITLFNIYKASLQFSQVFREAKFSLQKHFLLDWSPYMRQFLSDICNNSHSQIYIYLCI